MCDRKKTVYVDQEQDDDEQYLASFIVWWNGESAQFDDHASALEYAQELAEEEGLEVKDDGDWGVE